MLHYGHHTPPRVSRNSFHKMVSRHMVTFVPFGPILERNLETQKQEHLRILKNCIICKYHSPMIFLFPICLIEVLLTCCPNVNAQLKSGTVFINTMHIQSKLVHLLEFSYILGNYIALQ